MQTQTPIIANGTFTLTWPDGERHRTFSIRTMPSAEKQIANGRATPFAPGKRIISLMTGRDNETDYTSFGFVKDGEISIWQSMQNGTAKNAHLVWHEGKLTYWVNALLDLAFHGEQSGLYKMGYRLLAEEKCIVCNRKLTNPESIREKIGPECAKKRTG